MTENKGETERMKNKVKIVSTPRMNERRKRKNKSFVRKEEFTQSLKRQPTSKREKERGYVFY